MSRHHSRMALDLRQLAKRAMIERGFLAETPNEAKTEVDTKIEPAFDRLGVRDLRERAKITWHFAEGDDSGSDASCIRFQWGQTLVLSGCRV